MININYGHNKKLMDSCRDLYEYAFLIEEIRKELRTGTSLIAAVDRAVEVCIKEGILKNFLLRHRTEVKNVILEEFDWKKQIKLEKKESFEEGQELILALTQKLIESSRMDDLKRATIDRECRLTLLKEFNII